MIKKIDSNSCIELSDFGKHIILEDNNLTFKLLKGPINIELAMPSSKVMTHRAFIVAALANGQSRIYNPSICEDTLLTLNALKQLGIKIEENKEYISITGANGKFKSPKEPLNFNNSGTSLRFFITLCTLADQPVILTGNDLMKKRPVTHLLSALKQLGVKAESLEEEGFPPVKIYPGLPGGTCKLSGNISSQYFSSILLSSPFAEKSITIRADTEIKSRPYIDVTIDIMKNFGVSIENTGFGQNFAIDNNQQYSSQEYHLEGDFSNASYFFAAIAILGGKIKIHGLKIDSAQGDKFFLKCLERMGCKTIQTQEYIELSRNPKERLQGISIDLGNYPDIVQSLSIVASFASTSSFISNISHLKYKEVDRINATATELRKIGVIVETTNDNLKIIPPSEFKSAQINTYDDHRMAMSFSILAFIIPDLIIENPSCVEKSFPTFYKYLNQFYESIK